MSVRLAEARPRRNHDTRQNQQGAPARASPDHRPGNAHDTVRTRRCKRMVSRRRRRLVDRPMALWRQRAVGVGKNMAGSLTDAGFCHAVSIRRPRPALIEGQTHTQHQVKARNRNPEFPHHPSTLLVADRTSADQGINECGVREVSLQSCCVYRQGARDPHAPTFTALHAANNVRVQMRRRLPTHDGSRKIEGRTNILPPRPLDAARKEGGGPSAL